MFSTQKEEESSGDYEPPPEEKYNSDTYKSLSDNTEVSNFLLNESVLNTKESFEKNTLDNLLKSLFLFSCFS